MPTRDVAQRIASWSSRIAVRAEVSDPHPQRVASESQTSVGLASCMARTLRSVYGRKHVRQ